MPLTNLTKFGTLVPKTNTRYMKVFRNNILSNQKNLLETKNLKQLILTIVRGTDESKTHTMVTNLLYYLDYVPRPVSTKYILPRTQQQPKSKINACNRNSEASVVKSCRPKNRLISIGNIESGNSNSKVRYRNETTEVGTTSLKQNFKLEENHFQNTADICGMDSSSLSPAQQNVAEQRKNDIDFKCITESLIELENNNGNYLLLSDGKNLYRVFSKWSLENNGTVLVLEDCYQIVQNEYSGKQVQSSKSKYCPVSRTFLTGNDLQKTVTDESSENETTKPLNRIAKQIKVKNTGIPMFAKSNYAISNSSSILSGSYHNSMMNYIPQRLLCSFKKSDENKIDIGDLMPMPTKVPPEVKAQCELTMKIKDLLDNRNPVKKDNEIVTDEAIEKIEQCLLYKNKLKEKNAKTLRSARISKFNTAKEICDTSNNADESISKLVNDVNTKSLADEIEIRTKEVKLPSRQTFNRMLQKYVSNDCQNNAGEHSTNSNRKQTIQAVSFLKGNRQREIAKQPMKFQKLDFKEKITKAKYATEQSVDEDCEPGPKQKPKINTTERLFRIMNLFNEESAENKTLSNDTNDGKQNGIDTEKNSESNSQDSTILKDTRDVSRFSKGNLKDKPSKWIHSIERKDRKAENKSNKFGWDKNETVSLEDSKDKPEEKQFNAKFRKQMRQVLNITRKTYRPLSNRRKALVKMPTKESESEDKKEEPKKSSQEKNIEVILKTAHVTNKLCDLLGLPKKPDVLDMEECTTKHNETTTRLNILFEMQKRNEAGEYTECKTQQNLDEGEQDEETQLEQIRNLQKECQAGYAMQQTMTPTMDLEYSESKQEESKQPSSSNLKTESSQRKEEFKEINFRPKLLIRSKETQEDNTLEESKLPRPRTEGIDGACRTWLAEHGTEEPEVLKDYKKGHYIKKYDKIMYPKTQEVNAAQQELGKIFRKDSKLLLRELTKQLQTDSKEKQFKRSIHALMRVPTETKTFILNKIDHNETQNKNEITMSDAKSKQSMEIDEGPKGTECELDNGKLEEYGRNVFTKPTTSNAESKFFAVDPMLMLKKLMANRSGEVFDEAIERLKKQFYTFADKSILAIIMARGAAYYNDFNASPFNVEQKTVLRDNPQSKELNTIGELKTDKQLPKSIFGLNGFKFNAKNFFSESVQDPISEQKDL